MFSGSETVSKTYSGLEDSRFFSVWVSFIENLSTVTVTSSATATVTATTTSNELDQTVTIQPYPPVFSYLEVTTTIPAYTTVTESVSSCNDACPSMTAAPVPAETTSSAVGPLRNGTVPTSTRREESTTGYTSSRGNLRPSTTPPPLNRPVNGVSTTAGPVMGAVAVAIAGWVLML
jgi:hypothetical protein